MSLREDAVAYLGAILDEWLDAAGMSVEDATGALKEPLDATDRGMVLVVLAGDDEDGRQAAYYALAELHTLLRIRRRVSPRFDVTTQRGSYRQSQAVAQIEALIAAARTQALLCAGEAAVNGVVPSEPAGLEVVTGIRLDWSGGCRPESEYARW